MDNSEEFVDQRPFDIMIPSSPSDIGMITDAGGDPLAITPARGDPRQLQDVETQELRAEVVQLQQALNQETYASQQRSQEISTHLRGQAWHALEGQREQFRQVAHKYEQVSEDVTEAAVIRERPKQRAAQQPQLN